MAEFKEYEGVPNIAHLCAVEYFVFVKSMLTAYEYIYSQVFAPFLKFHFFSIFF